MKEFLEWKNSINENSGIGRVFNWLNKIGEMFRDPEKIQNSVSNTIDNTDDAKIIKNFNPKLCALKETYFILMGDEGENRFSIAITKLADLENNVGLFQISGTTNEEMLNSLVNSNDISDLVKKNIFALISNTSINVDKPMEIKILRNILNTDKDYVSTFNVKGIIDGMSVEKAIKNI